MTYAGKWKCWELGRPKWIKEVIGVGADATAAALDARQQAAEHFATIKEEIDMDFINEWTIPSHRQA